MPRTDVAGWILRRIRFHGTKHPEQIGSEQVEEFLNTWHQHSFGQLKHRIELHSDLKMLL